MNHFFLSGLLNSVIWAALGIFVYLKNRRNPINWTFGLFALSVTIYAFAFSQQAIAMDKERSLFWIRIILMGTIFVPVFFLQFTYAVLKKKIKRHILIGIYIIAVILEAINFLTEWFATNPIPKYIFRYLFQAGFLYPVLVLFFAIISTHAFFELYKGYRKSVGSRRNQLKYLFWAPFVGFIGGTEGFLLGYNCVCIYPFIPVATYAVSTYGVLIAYAVVRYRLMDINFVITKTVAYSILLITSTAMYIALAVGADRVFAGSLWYDAMPAHAAVFLLMAALFIYFVPHIKTTTEKAVEKALFKNKFLYRDELRNFGRKISFGISQKELLSNTVNFIAKGMQSPYILIVLRNESYDNYMPETWAGFSDEEIKELQFEENNAMIKWLSENKEVLIREEIALIEDSRIRKDIENELKRIKAYLCIPLCVSANFIGFLSLSERSNGEMYSHIDIGLLQNITNEISLVIAYKQLERHALQTEKLASLGTLAAGLAHEIRNPLSSIQIFAQLLPQKYNDEEFRNEFSPIVVREVQRITSLIENVLSLSKTRPPEMASNDINALIEETLSLLTSEIKKNKIQIIKTYAHVSPVKGNKEELKQVFLNIILNGIQAMPNGGTLKIESSFISSLTEEEEKQYYARVKIQDTGGGIEEHTLKKMFDPFFTTKPQGTGLGLALAHRIIEQHNGFIGVSSQAGKGVMFWVDLPISQIG